jgi:hypothetical protein
LEKLVHKYSFTSMKHDFAIRFRCSAPFLWLTLFVSVCHFPLLLNNGVYWDGWLIYGLHANRNSAQLFAWFTDSGIPWIAYLHRMMWWAGDIVLASKITAFSSILLSTLMLYSISRRTRVFSANESLFLAALFCSYTAYQMYFELITLPYIVCYSLFLTATRLALITPAITPLRLAFRALSLALFFLSFLTSSFLVMYCSFFVVLVVHHRHTWLRNSVRSSLIRLMQYADYLLLPLAYWYIKINIWITSGLYANYNKINIDIDKWPLEFHRFATAAIQNQFERAFWLNGDNPMWLAAFGSCSLLVGYACLRRLNITRDIPVRRSSVLEFFALASICAVLLGAAVFPYIVVEKIPNSTGWSTRHALLINLPVALAVTLLGRLVNSVLPRELAKYGQATVATLLLSGFVVSTWGIYLNWQLRWIKDSSTIVNLRALSRSPLSEASMIWVDDDYQRWQENYVFYEYAGIFKAAWHEERHFGNPLDQPMDVTKFASGLPLDRYMMRDLRIADLSNCRASLHIRFNVQEVHDLPLVMHYYWVIFFQESRLDSFLKPLTTLSVSDFSCAAQRYENVVTDLRAIRNALTAYHADHGSYPVAAVSVGDASHPDPDRWIPGLSPHYLSQVPRDPRRLSASNRQYLYMSNGRDYKIITHGAEEAEYGRKARPELVDPRRPEYAFGFWSPGFANE